MTAPEDLRRSSIVSVMMPVYNTARYLPEAIESVLDQSYRNFELVIVDDCSSDGSWEIVQRYAARDARIRALRNEHNRKIVWTRNRLLREVRPDADYLAPADSDDVCLPNRLADQVAFLDANPDYALVGGNLLIIDDDSRVTGERKYPSGDAAIRRVITRYNPFAQPTALVRKAAIDAVGPYDESFAVCEDYDLWLRIAARYRVANLDTFTLKYRLRSTQSKSRQLKETLRQTVRVQERWMFHPGLFSPRNVAYVALERLLLIAPDSLVLGLFKAVTYRRR